MTSAPGSGSIRLADEDDDGDLSRPANPPSRLSYTLALLSTPAPKISWLLVIADAPYLVALYKVVKWIWRVLLWRGSEVQRVLQRSIDARTRYSVRLPLEGDDTSEPVDAEEIEDLDEEDEVRLLHRRETSKAREEDLSSQLQRSNSLGRSVLDPGAIWRVGLAIEHSRQLSTQNSALKEECSSADLIELARDISAIKSIPNERSLQTELLSSLKRLNEIYTQENELLLRSQQQYDKDSEEHQNMLRELWQLLKPDKALESLSTKQWQDLGFQGKDPSTDWRATGLLGLDTLLSFARSRQAQGGPRKIVIEAVEGGAGWYPFAIATISITSFTINLVQSQALLYLFLSNSQQRVSETFSSLTTSLIEHFHSHWRYLQTSEDPVELAKTRPTVMDFEQVFKSWKHEVERWLRRGLVGGRVDSRGLVLHSLPEQHESEALRPSGSTLTTKTQAPLVDL